MRFQTLILVLIVCFSGISYATYASDTAAKDMVCLTTHYPPYTIYRDKQQDFVGLDMRYINKLASKLNWNLTVLNFPWGRLKLEIEKDQFNCFFSLAYEPQRAKYLDYTHHPLHTTEYGVFFLKGKRHFAQQNLANQIVGVLRGVPLAPKALKQNNLNQAKFVFLDSNETLLSILHTGRVDASVLNYQVGLYLLNAEPNSENIDSFKVAEYQLPVYLAFRKGTQDVKVVDIAFEQVIAELEKGTTESDVLPVYQVNEVLVQP